MQDRNKFDDFLNRTLDEFSNVSPRAGLEERVLANLKQPESRRRWMWAWIAVPALGLVLLVALLWKPAPRSADVVKVVIPTVQPAPQPTMPTATHSRNVRRERSRPVRSVPKSREPRLATFPSRDENDELIRLALRFAQEHPEVAADVAEEQRKFREMAAAFTKPLSREEQ